MKINEQEFIAFEKSITDKTQIGKEFNARYQLNDPVLATSDDYSILYTRILQVYVDIRPTWTSSNSIAR